MCDLIMLIIGGLLCLLDVYLLNHLYKTPKCLREEKYKIPNIVFLLILIAGCIPIFNLAVGIGCLIVVSISVCSEEIYSDNWLFKKR